MTIKLFFWWNSCDWIKFQLYVWDLWHTAQTPTISPLKLGLATSKTSLTLSRWGLWSTCRFYSHGCTYHRAYWAYATPPLPKKKEKEKEKKGKKRKKERCWLWDDRVTKSTFPNVYALLHLPLFIPVTSASASWKSQLSTEICEDDKKEQDGREPTECTVDALCAQKH